MMKPKVASSILCIVIVTLLLAGCSLCISAGIWTNHAPSFGVAGAACILQALFTFGVIILTDAS